VEKDKYEPRLLHVKGRRNIRVQQVMEDKGDGEGTCNTTHNLVIVNTLREREDNRIYCYSM